MAIPGAGAAGAICCPYARLGIWGQHPDAKPLRSFGGAGILEIVEDHTGDTYPALYRSAWRVWRVAICLTCVSEEIKERDPDAERRDRANQIASQASQIGRASCREREEKQRSQA